MPVNVTEADAFTAPLQVPVAGELASAPGLLSQFLQGIANRSNWLRRRVEALGGSAAIAEADAWSTGIRVALGMAAGNAFELLARDLGDRTLYIANTVPGVGTNIAMQLPHVAHFMANFIPDAGVLGSGGIKFVQSVTATAGSLWIPIPVPPRGVILRAIMYVKGDIGDANAHGGTPPATRPTLILARQPVNVSASPTILGTQAEAAVGGIAYDLLHAVTLDIPDHTILPLNNYYAVVTGETGAGAIDNKFGVFGVRVDFGRVP